jgi:hypothetical protein
MYGGGGLLDFRKQGIELSGIGAVGEKVFFIFVIKLKLIIIILIKNKIN